MYLEKLLAVQDAAASALLTLGDGNWRMGDGVRVAGAQKLGVGSEQILLEHYICTNMSFLCHRLALNGYSQMTSSILSCLLWRPFLARNRARPSDPSSNSTMSPT